MYTYMYEGPGDESTLVDNIFNPPLVGWPCLLGGLRQNRSLSMSALWRVRLAEIDTERGDPG